MALFDQNDAGGTWSQYPVVEERQRRHHRTTKRHKVLHPCRGARSFFLDLMTGGVDSLNHRLLALMPPASFCYGMSLFFDRDKLISKRVGILMLN